MLEEGKPETSVAYKQWTFTLDLCEYMYHDGLLDRQEFLHAVLEMMERFRPEEPQMRLLMPVILKYTKEFTRSQLLSRKLAFHCCHKITAMVNDTDALHAATSAAADLDQQPVTANHPVMQAFYELMNDPYTRFIIFGLSAVVQHITLECPAALVWHNYGEGGKSPAALVGSPLDHLPNCAPSGLPMPPRQSNPSVRHRIKEYETMIKDRSAAVEGKNVRFFNNMRGHFFFQQKRFTVDGWLLVRRLHGNLTGFSFCSSLVGRGRIRISKSQRSDGQHHFDSFGRVGQSGF